MAWVDLATGQPVGCGMWPVDKPIVDSITQIYQRWWPGDDIDLIYIEQMYHGPNPSTTVKLAGAAGMIHMAARLWLALDAPVEYITPGEWRKELGLPHTGKEPCMEYAESHGFDTGGSQDAADAACIALAGWLINDTGIARAQGEGDS